MSKQLNNIISYKFLVKLISFVSVIVLCLNEFRNYMLNEMYK